MYTYCYNAKRKCVVKAVTALFFLFCLSASFLFAQSSCPLNIDFETGTFQNWQCYKGIVQELGIANVITVNPSVATSNIHTIVPKGVLVDYYGNFPISAPNGGNYSVRLGNDGTGAQAERISYTFNVPANQTNFSLTYQYAVVLQDGGHTPLEQPRFTAKVFDVAANSYITCSSFDYVATSQLPGFKKSTVLSNVVYKSWTPVTLNLSGYQGKQIRLEFTTSDCTVGGHFGYAYVDINQNCTNLITGADYCSYATSVSLSGPAGYDKYNWYNADKSKLLGTTNPLVLTTPPADGTVFVLDIIPFDGFGCSNTVSTIVHRHEIGLSTIDPAPVCFPNKVDVTQTSVVTTLDNSAILTYWKDAACTIPLPDPQDVTISGTYYIRAMNAVGCTEIKPVKVVADALPDIKVTNPPTVCFLSAVDITSSMVAVSPVKLTYSYWQDAAATIPLTNANAITAAGTYYIKGVNAGNCSDIKPVNVTFFPLPILNINPPLPVCVPSTVDITQAAVTFGSDNNLTYSYWRDSIAAVPIADPSKISESGTYYIKAVNIHGCQLIKPVTVTVYPLPQLAITNPAGVCFPEKINIGANEVTAGSTLVNKYTYWKDSIATVALNNYTAVTDSGIYYIKATSIYGCEVIKPVLVTIHKLPVIKISPPSKVYQPNKVDITNPAIVKGSSPKLKYSYYADASLTIALERPQAVETTGTYYIKAENASGCFSSAAVDVVIALKPDIVVPKAFTPTQATNKTLYPFAIGIQHFKSFIVYNRWGNIVFKTTEASADNGWDGTDKGKIPFLDTYTWVADGYDYVGNLVHRTGNTVVLK